MSNPKSSSASLPSSSSKPDLPIEFLCRLIPDSFDGNRFELGQFIANCNNANDVAPDELKAPLLYYILARIKDRKHYTQIMEELNNCKQRENESVSDFFQRLEILNARALTAVRQYSKNTEDIPGKITTINEITLNRFVFHSSPPLFQMLR
ncbi:UNVERIFIED_CONTAM: hypothetical protein PYX00_000006 [Menopon gallinae]|uniref:Uncharacterized protein n=1 Tax=Menopon gallinae TaxID=328185 RepID=A0AAW2I6W0_9NEOP